jgi:hypothetical protein
MQKPVINLVGEDGNAFFIIGKAVKLAKQMGWTPEKIKEFKDEMISGDYYHLLTTVSKHFKIE